jgi:hypothetical protein
MNQKLLDKFQNLQQQKILEHNPKVAVCIERGHHQNVESFPYKMVILKSKM